MKRLSQSAHRWLLTAGLLLVSIVLLPAQDKLANVALPEGVTKVTSVEGITEYQLKNGLRVLLFPDPSKPTVTVNITYLVGSRHEGLGESGMAHLLEHMVFKGSLKHKNIMQELTEHGTWPNGTTWLDRTNYFETFSATDENLKWALDLESDRMVNSFIDKKDLETEFTVVRNEFEIGENSPQWTLEKRVMSAAYLWHNYGRSTIGSKEDIERVPIENLKAFYQKYYQPDNAVLLVAGKFDEAKTLGLVSQYFGPISRPARPLTKTYTVEPTQDGERQTTLRRVGDTQGVAAAYHTPAGSHPDYAVIDVLMDVLTNEPSGRLYKALIENKKAAGQYGWTPALHDPGFAYFYAELRKEQSLDSARSVMLATLDEVSKKAPTAEEVERAKTKLLKDIDLLFKNTDRLGLQLSEWIATGDWRLVFLYRDALRKVQPADVQRVAAAYFKPSNRTVGVFVPDQKPDRAEIPDTPDVAALVNGYKGEAAVVAGEAFDVSPANIDARTKRGAEANGLKWALLPKSTRGNSVNVQVRLRYGDEKSLMNQSLAARFAAQMLERGSKTRSYQQIKDELDKLKARAYVYGYGQSAMVSIEAEKDKLPAVTKIVMDYLKNPAFPPTEFDKLKQEALAQIESQKQEPQAIAWKTLRRLTEPYPKGHPFYTMTFDEEVDALNKLTLDQVKDFYKNFYGAQDATVAVVGAFDEVALRKQIKDELGSWKAVTPFSRIPQTLFAGVKSQTQSIQTNDKTSAVFAGGMQVALRDDDPDYPAFALANYVLGEGMLNSRLATRIRVKDGLSYGVGSYVYADDNDRVGGFGSYAIFNPENAEKFDNAYREEVQKMVKDGVTAEEVKAAKSAILQEKQLERSQDGMLARKWSQYLTKKEGRSFAYDADFDKKLEALTPEQVNAALKKYIDYSKLTMVKAGDFEKAAKKLAERSQTDKQPATSQPAAAVGSGKKN